MTQSVALGLGTARPPEQYVVDDRVAHGVWVIEDRMLYALVLLDLQTIFELGECSFLHGISKEGKPRLEASL